MPITWDVTLPQIPLVEGYSEEEVNTTLSFEPDVGPPITRKRGDAGLSPMKFTMEMDGAQLATLRNFYRDTTGGGALKFDFPHPFLGSVQVQFMGPPKWSAFGGDYWKVQLELGRL